MLINKQSLNETNEHVCLICSNYVYNSLDSE